MGYAIARVAAQRGALVTLVSGPCSLECPAFVTRINVTSAADMFNEVVKHAGQSDIIIKAAAVADYTPVTIADEKIKKKTGDLSIELKRTADILKYLGENKREGQFLCGFSMETENLLENSRKKLIDKNADMIIANNLKMEGAGFGTGTNIVTIITKDGYKEPGRMDKEDVAVCILDEIYKESIAKQ